MGVSCSVVVLAAGRGTRMKSALPKVLHPLCGRTLLGHALTAAQSLNPSQVVAVVRHERDMVAAEVSRVLPNALIADQDEVPGTGRAVYCALRAAEQAGVPLGDTIVVTSGDVPLLEAGTLQDLVTKHQESGAAVTLVTTIADQPFGYGRVIRSKKTPELAERIVEQKDASSEELAVKEINAGIYAFDAAFLGWALSRVDQDNSQGEVYLTDTVALAVAEGRRAVPYVLRDQWQAEGCNDLLQLSTLRSVLNERTIRRHLLAGVSIVDPVTTAIDVGVELEADAVIEPCTQLRGTTTVALGAVVGPGSTLKDVEVGAGAHVPHCALTNDKVEDGERLAAFTVRRGNRSVRP